MVDDGEVQLLVDRLAILGVRVAQDLDDALELADEILDLACGQPCSVATGPEGNLGSLPGELHFFDPLADDGGVGACFEGLPVLRELVVAFLELLARSGESVLLCDVGPCSLLEGGTRLVDVIIIEELSEPPVDRRGECVLPHVDGAGVLALTDGVLLGELAAVVGASVVPRTLHPSSAAGAVDVAAEEVGVLGSFATNLRPLGAGEHRFSCSELCEIDDGVMSRFVGPDPVASVVPAHLRLVAERNIFDVDQLFMALLAVPDLVAGVTGVLEDCTYGDLAPDPSAAGSVAIAGTVVAGWGEDAVARESFRDGVEAGSANEFVEDPSDHWSRLGVRLEHVQALPDRRLGWVRVRACVAKPVAVRRTTAEEATFDSGL